MELVRDVRPINILVKWSEKNYGCKSASGDFQCVKLENAEKIRWKNSFMVNPEFMLNNIIRPTFVPNLMAWAWKNEPRNTNIYRLINIIMHMFDKRGDSEWEAANAGLCLRKQSWQFPWNFDIDS